MGTQMKLVFSLFCKISKGNHWGKMNRTLLERWFNGFRWWMVAILLNIFQLKDPKTCVIEVAFSFVSWKNIAERFLLWWRGEIEPRAPGMLGRCFTTCCIPSSSRTSVKEKNNRSLLFLSHEIKLSFQDLLVKKLFSTLTFLVLLHNLITPLKVSLFSCLERSYTYVLCK